VTGIANRFLGYLLMVEAVSRIGSASLA
jgi:hypothetical protein